MAANYWTRRHWARRRFLAGVGALGGAAFIAACGGGDDDEDAQQATPASGGAPAAGGQATPAGRQAPATKIGSFIDRTGPTANVGNPVGQGNADFIAYANANNLAGRQVEAVEFDHSYAVDKAQEGYKKFVEQENVSAILSYGTPITDALAPAAAEDEVPLYTPGFGLSESGNGTKYPYLYVGAASYTSQAMALLQHFKDSWKDSSRKAKVYFLYYGNAAGRDPLEAIRSMAPKLDLDLVGTLEVPATTTDLTQQMLEVKSKEPDYVMTHFFGAMPALGMKGAQQAGLAADKYFSFVWGGGDGDFKAAGPAADNTHVLQFTTLLSENPEVWQKMKDWHAKQGKPIDESKISDSVYYIRGVFNMGLIFESIRQAGEKDKITGEDVKKGADSIKDFTNGGLSPGITMSSSDHDGTRKVKIYQWKNGKQNLVKDWFEGPKPS